MAKTKKMALQPHRRIAHSMSGSVIDPSRVVSVRRIAIGSRASYFLGAGT